MAILKLLAFASALAASVQAGFSPSSKSNVVIYWGQNSAGQQSTQTRLSDYCNSSEVDVILLAFLLRFNGAGGQPILNFANQGDKCSLFSGTETFSCPEIELDIKTCQSKGKTIMLSLGGDSYNEGGYTSADAATEGANKLWAQFGPVQSGSSVLALRPFGTAVVDGFDFDFEANVSNMAVFGNRLKTLFASGGKPFYLSAAPQCPYPDWYNQDILNNVPLDFINVQFYNNYCGVQSFVSGQDPQNNFNIAQWDSYAKASKNPATKILVGVPAAQRAAGSGYISASQLAPVLQYSARYSSFGGVMMWDASQAWNNGNFLVDVKNSLRGLGKRAMRWGFRAAEE
ncbi:glycoside hydrolase family 18 protein [Periconia macrospinosa]|uniref:chitinase n=1 Tax=Periconia macrospinosa TaxID=97972 RepID=A0A2V1DDX9_9PLEO|nr:glycoside hydrolase family 18 protein [Periconia macrospinosa]